MYMTKIYQGLDTVVTGMGDTLGNGTIIQLWDGKIIQLWDGKIIQLWDGKIIKLKHVCYIHEVAIQHLFAF